MQRSSRKAWLVLWLGLFGCSFTTDFDRGKIDEFDAGGLGDGSVGQMDALPDGTTSMDAQTDGDMQPQPDGAQPEAGPQPEAGGGCSSDTQCPANQLCCGGQCVNTAATTQCTACGQSCGGSGANTCTNRQCGCDNGPPCGGATPYCVANTSGVSSCVECADSTACEGRSDGKTQCIDNRCSACDPKDNSGCMGTTPICDATSRTCVKCTMGRNECGGNTVCTSSGACGGCDDASDCPTPTAPICDMAVAPTVCRGCGSDNECGTQMPNRPLCANDGRCGVCKPVANAADPGCDIASATPACRTNAAGQYQCRECSANGQCAPGRPNCRGGRCVECAPASSGQPAIACTDPTKPVCDSGVCRACAAATEATDCGGSTPACLPNGACGVCRPGGPNGCPGSTNTTCSALFTCVDCSASEGCPAGQQCKLGLPPMCVDCINNAGCMGMQQCNVATNSCVPCLAPNLGCANGVCLTNPSNPAMNRCVECIVPADCGTNANKCVTNTCMGNVCGTEPIAGIDDQIACTQDSCDMATGAITHMPNPALCMSDMCTMRACTGGAGADPMGCTSTPIVICDAGTCDPQTGMCGM